MAGTTHIYAGVAGTVGMSHSGNLAGVFRQALGGGKWAEFVCGPNGCALPAPTGQRSS